jgi:hypothetical protein
MRDEACSEGLSQSDQTECKPIIHLTLVAGSAIRVSSRLVPDLTGNVPCQVMAPLSVLQSSRVHLYLVYAVRRGVGKQTYNPGKYQLYQSRLPGAAGTAAPALRAARGILLNLA